MKTKILLSLFCIATFSFALLTFNSNAQAPGWAWAKSAAGNSNDVARSVTADNSGYIYVVGVFGSPTITFGSTVLTNAASGYDDIFIVKYNPSGTVLWAINVGGTSNEVANSVTTDASGNVYVAGEYSSATVAFGTTTLTNANPGFPNMFVAKFDASGNEIWAESAGGSDFDRAFSVVTDASANVYVAGAFASSTIDFETTTLTNANTAFYDVFITKYDSSGNVIWAKGGIVSTGGIYNNNYANSVTTDGSGNVYISGSYQSASFTLGSFTLTNSYQASSKMYIAKYDAGGAVLWAKANDGGVPFSPTNAALAVVADATGNTYVGGYYDHYGITFGSTTLTNAGGYDIFLVKYDSNGNVIWAKSAGGNSDDYVYSLATDTAANIYASGYFAGTNIVFGTDTLLNPSFGYSDIFIAKYDSSGNALWGIRTGGTANDEATSVATNASGDIYLAGDFSSPTVTFGTTTFTNTYNGTSDMFIAKLGTLTEIESMEKNTGIAVFPNPFNSSATINIDAELNNLEINIYNSFGQLVKKINNISEQHITLYRNNFSTGIYLIQFIKDNVPIATEKIVITE